ncbi:MAG: hypothetical protein HYV25_02025, partial [Candidatus Harrisonbacteria bacterium]|nr:hypothetical protein [Candidatus Harrisonbacteria bacterium]
MKRKKIKKAAKRKARPAKRVRRTKKAARRVAGKKHRARKEKKAARKRPAFAKASARKAKKLTKAEARHEINVKHLEELILRGRGRGFVTDSEVLVYFPHIEEDVAFLEEVYDRLDKAGMKVVETSQLIELPKEEVSIKELEEATSFSGELPDAVQMYLKEIGKTPLLTGEDERELAKRIEKGDEEARKKFIQANLRLVVSIA